MKLHTYVYYVIIKDEPQTTGFHNRDVVATVRPGAAMDHDGDKVVHPIWVDGIVGLNMRISKLYCTSFNLCG